MSEGTPAPTSTPPPAGETPPTPPPETPPPTPELDLAAEVEKWKALSKKNEDRAKANAKAAADLEQLKQQSMSDQEKAVAQAKAQGLAEGRALGATRLVDAEVRVAAKGRVADIDALLEGLDRTKFVGDDGEPDRAAITSWVDRIAPEGEPQTPGFPDIGQGNRTQAMALNGDPLERSLKNALGIR